MPIFAVGEVTVLGHQGGWDEALFIAVPLILFAVLLVIARRRLDDVQASDSDDTDTPGKT